MLMWCAGVLAWLVPIYARMQQKMHDLLNSGKGRYTDEGKEGAIWRIYEEIETVAIQK
jgi:hypothetical protein